MKNPVNSEGGGNQFCGRTRREFLWQTGGGFTATALAGAVLFSLLPPAWLVWKLVPIGLSCLLWNNLQVSKMTGSGKLKT